VILVFTNTDITYTNSNNEISTSKKHHTWKKISKNLATKYL